MLVKYYPLYDVRKVIYQYDKVNDCIKTKGISNCDDYADVWYDGNVKFDVNYWL